VGSTRPLRLILIDTLRWPAGCPTAAHRKSVPSWRRASTSRARFPVPAIQEPWPLAQATSLSAEPRGNRRRAKARCGRGDGRCALVGDGHRNYVAADSTEANVDTAEWKTHNAPGPLSGDDRSTTGRRVLRADRRAPPVSGRKPGATAGHVVGRQRQPGLIAPPCRICAQFRHLGLVRRSTNRFVAPATVPEGSIGHQGKLPPLFPEPGSRAIVTPRPAHRSVSRLVLILRPRRVAGPEPARLGRLRCNIPPTSPRPAVPGY